MTRVRWQAASAPYSLEIEVPADPTSADSQRLRIRVPGRRDYLLSGNEDGFVAMSGPNGNGVINPSLVADNLAPSPYFYLTPKLRGAHGSPMLILFGSGFASDPGSIYIIALDSTGYPTQVFRDSTFLLTALVDLDRDGTAEVIGKPTLTQCGGCGTCSYDPYAVYRLPDSAHHRVRYDLALSRNYNLAHYVWAGPKSTESLDVNECLPGKPRIVGRHGH